MVSRLTSMSSRAARSSLMVILLDANHPLLRFIFWSQLSLAAVRVELGWWSRRPGCPAHNTGRTGPPSPPTSHRIPTTNHLKKNPDFNLFCKLYRNIDFFVNLIFNHVLHGNMRHIVECATNIFAPVSVDSTCITYGNFPPSSQNICGHLESH